jgi:hypothetical protein
MDRTHCGAPVILNQTHERFLLSMRVHCCNHPRAAPQATVPNPGKQLEADCIGPLHAPITINWRLAVSPLMSWWAIVALCCEDFARLLREPPRFCLSGVFFEQ